MFTPSVTFDPTFTIIEKLLYGNLSEVSFLDHNPELPLAGYCNVDYEINETNFNEHIKKLAMYISSQIHIERSVELYVLS